VGWTGNNELYSISDDKQIIKWSGEGDFIQTVSKFEPNATKKDSLSVFVTDLAWIPVAPGKGQGTAEIFVVGATDGYFYIVNKNGIIEKAVEAHMGSVLCVEWNFEATAFVTGGEDGQIKIWSKSGMLRSTLMKTNFPIYSIVWSPDNQNVLYTNGKNLVIKSLQPGNKPNQVFLE
jgi:intraflagellar transport protein 80